MTDVAPIRQIIATQHFTNVHARDDRGSREITRLIVNPAHADPDCWLKVMIGVCTNEPAALAWVNWAPRSPSLRPQPVASVPG
jgi:hypothetical protein